MSRWRSLMCFSFKEISLRSVSLPLPLCARKALHFRAERRTRVHVNVMKPWTQFMADITPLTNCGRVHKLTSWLLCTVMRISKWHFPLMN